MSNPNDGLGFLINDVARLLRRNFMRRAQADGLSLAEWRALAYLSRQEGINQTDLAESMEIQPMTLARLIDKLQHLGLVERRKDPQDRRAYRLYLTKASQPLISKLWAIAEESRELALAGLSERRRKDLMTALMRVKANLFEAEQSAALDVVLSSEND